MLTVAGAIAAGAAKTVATAVVRQPVVDNMYVISAVPAATPVIAPPPDVTVALAVLPLVHVPPVVLESAPVTPSHIVRLPVIAEGFGFTVIVTGVLVIQPALEVIARLYALVPVVVGVIVGAGQLAHDKPAAPVHANVDAGITPFTVILSTNQYRD
jgi:hypothetical protein